MVHLQYISSHFEPSLDMIQKSHIFLVFNICDFNVAYVSIYFTSVDGRNPASPGIYNTLYINNGRNYQPQLLHARFLNHQTVPIKQTNSSSQNLQNFPNNSRICNLSEQTLPSRELTYPTWGKGTSSSKVP